MKERKTDDILYLISDTHPKKVINWTPFLWFLVFIGFASCFLSLGAWYYAGNCVTLVHYDAETNPAVDPVCTGIPDLEKFDCHPEDNGTETSCQQRGCCFQPRQNSSPTLGVPYCFYPSNYVGYSLINVLQDDRYIRAILKRRKPSGLPNDMQNLKLVVTNQDDHTIRIKLFAPFVRRFEVPIPIDDTLKELKKPIYDVKINNNTGQLVISRKSTGTVVFNTNLSRLIYSDQFLQLSTRLPSPYFYGIGENYGSFLRNMNWTRITLFNNDRSPTPNYPLYGSHPFYLSLESDGNANGVFLLNSNAMDVILQPAPAITFRPIGGVLDFFVMLGPSPANVVQQYTSIVGRTFMPPYWSLGFHLCRYGYNSLNKTKETMQRNIDAGVPIDVQWNDIDYMDRYKDFTYDEDKFAGLPEFVEELHKNGRHYVIMTDPGISNSEKPGTYPPYDDGLKDNIFIKNPNGSIFIGKVWSDGNTVFPDFSHPNSTDYWVKQFTDFHAKIKYDGVWIDMNEPSNFHDGSQDGCMESTFEDPIYLPGGNLPLRRKTLCMTARHYMTMHYNEHNLLAYREATATNKALRTIRNRRPFIISRASFAGQGGQSGHWSGDIYSNWEDLRYSIPSILNFNLYGMSMIGSDICGFNLNTTVPLCARWQALGAFYPFSRNHNENGAFEQDPVAMGPLVVEATKQSLQIRYLLLPYLYTLFARSHVFGDTVARPLFFEYPQDKNTYSIDEQFMWGPGFMVIPALYPNVTNVTAYFPKGIWYDNNGRAIKSAGEKMTLPSNLTEIIVAIRGGYILPAQIAGPTTTESRKNPFLLVGGLDENQQAAGELYWDDGDSLNTYENGSYSVVKFTVNENVLQTTVEHNGYDGTMDLGAIQLAGVDKVPTKASVNGIDCIKVTIAMKESSLNIFSSPKFHDKTNITDPKTTICTFYSVQPNGLGVGLSGFSLKSPLTVTWN